MRININEAKIHFSRIINQALKGEEVIITKDGKPVVRLTPYTSNESHRQGGQFQGLIQIKENFDAPLPEEILKQFYNDQD